MRLARLVVVYSIFLLTARTAHAADAFSLQAFRPAIDSKGYITVNASQILGHLDFSLALVGTYMREPLVLTDGPRRFAVTDVVTPQLQLAVGFVRWFELGLSLPVHILFGARAPRYDSAAPNASSNLTFGAQHVGDLGLHAKVRLLNTSRHPVGLALLASVYAPTSPRSAQLLGEGQVTIRPELILDKEFGWSRRFRMALNVGALIRPHKNRFVDEGALLRGDPTMNGGGEFCWPIRIAATATTPPACGTGLARELGTQLTYGLGLSGSIVQQKFDLLLEFSGYADLTGAANAHPLEVAAAAKVYLASKSYFLVGAGASLIPDQTAGPLARVFIGFIFEPSIGDRDGDGIKDDVDRCPDDPEDLDDFEDADGCPDPDNDRDGIIDRLDKCPNEPETKNGYQDDDGCPDTVELDRDGDGIPDRLDKCPDDPEDLDRFEDDDGCPDPDNDKDGILDIDDLCPNEPEDFDKFEDADGCPDPDNDKDRILDKDDKCPNEPETYNGYKDDDGCPDKGLARTRRGRVEIFDSIHFETASAVIKPESYPTLDAVAATLAGNVQIKLLEIQGHADERGDDDYNLELTEARSQSVKQYLSEHGVAVDRLQAHGYGETKPVCRKHTAACWSRNRRVEFIILRQEGFIPGQN